MSTDIEQIQMLKDWWKQYGISILVTLIVVVIVNFGWRYWNQYKIQSLERASIAYTQMLMSFEQKNSDEAKLYAQSLMQDYPKSSYAGLAAVMLAKIAVQSGDFKLAQEQLQFVIKKSSNKAFRQIARIRLARILLETKQSQEAFNLLNTVDDDAYITEINEASGDALMALGKVEEAKQAYQKAKDMKIKGAKSPLLQLKLQQF